MITRSKSGIFKPKLYIATLINKELETIPKALNDKNWYKAMKEEYEVALIRNETWSLVPPPAEYKIVENKWVFRVKQNSDDSIAKYKARLVAQGFQQTKGIDYFDILKPLVVYSHLDQQRT